MAMGILKGIGTLLRRNKGRGPNVKLTPEQVAQRRLREAEGDPVVRALMDHKYGRGPNRKLTPEEIAQRNLESAKEATQVAKGRYEKASTQLDEMLQPYRMKGIVNKSTAMRAKQVGDETMEMIRDSVMKMDLPADKKLEAFRGAMETLNKLPPAQLAKANPTQLSMDIIKMAGAGGAGFVGGAMMEGMAREGRLPEMIQDSFLVRPEFRGMREPSRAVGKMMDATQMGLVNDQTIYEEPSFGEQTAEFLMDYLQPLPRSMGKPRD